MLTAFLTISMIGLLLLQTVRAWYWRRTANQHKRNFVIVAGELNAQKYSIQNEWPELIGE